MAPEVDHGAPAHNHFAKGVLGEAPPLLVCHGGCAADELLERRVELECLGALQQVPDGATARLPPHNHVGVELNEEGAHLAKQPLFAAVNESNAAARDAEQRRCAPCRGLGDAPRGVVAA